MENAHDCVVYFRQSIKINVRERKCELIIIKYLNQLA